jgi:hypothetical protein
MARFEIAIGNILSFSESTTWRPVIAYISALASVGFAQERKGIFRDS